MTALDWAIIAVLAVSAVTAVDAPRREVGVTNEMTQLVARPRTPTGYRVFRLICLLAIVVVVVYLLLTRGIALSIGPAIELPPSRPTFLPQARVDPPAGPPAFPEPPTPFPELSLNFAVENAWQRVRERSEWVASIAARGTFIDTDDLLMGQVCACVVMGEIERHTALGERWGFMVDHTSMKAACFGEEDEDGSQDTIALMAALRMVDAELRRIGLGRIVG